MRLRTACRTRGQATIPTKTLHLRLWPFKISRGTTVRYYFAGESNSSEKAFPPVLLPVAWVD